MSEVPSRPSKKDTEPKAPRKDIDPKVLQAERIFFRGFEFGQNDQNLQRHIYTLVRMLHPQLAFDEETMDQAIALSTPKIVNYVIPKTGRKTVHKQVVGEEGPHGRTITEEDVRLEIDARARDFRNTFGQNTEIHGNLDTELLAATGSFIARDR